MKKLSEGFGSSKEKRGTWEENRINLYIDTLIPIKGGFFNSFVSSWFPNTRLQHRGQYIVVVASFND